MFVLTLFANNGGSASLQFETIEEAKKMKNAFMNTGEYSNATIEFIEK